MRQFTWSRMIVVVLAAASVAGFLLLAPTSLGGTATWVTTSGNSMEPGIRAGDLVITRPDTGYRTGDVVAYPSDTLHGTVVLHRIVGRSPDGFLTRGDNNNWIDPDRPRPSQLLGEMWLHIPGGGRMLSIFANPILLAGIAVGLLAVGGSGVGLHRARRRSGDPRDRARSPRHVSSPGTTIGRPRAGGTDLSRAWAEWSAIAAIVFAGVAVFAFSQPRTTRAETDVDFRNTAELGYSAHVSVPGVYAANQVQTGDPVFLALASEVDTHARYRLQADSSDVTGTIQAVARIAASNGWQHAVTLTPPSTFVGPEAELDATVDFATLQRAARAAEKAAGTTFGGYTVEVGYRVDVEGAVNGRPARTRYQPKLSFSLDSTQAIPQARVDEATGSEPVVHASAPGHLTGPTLEPNTVHLLGQDVPVGLLRLLATGLALLSGGVAALTAVRSRRHRPADHGSMDGRLITVSNIELGARPIVDISDADSLARLATRYDTAVLHIARPDGDVYHVVLDDTIYRYARPAPANADVAPPAHLATHTMR